MYSMAPVAGATWLYIYYVCIYLFTCLSISHKIKGNLVILKV